MERSILLLAIALGACVPPAQVWDDGPDRPVAIRACAREGAPEQTPRQLLLAAVAALAARGYRIRAVDAAAGVVVTEHASPLGFPLSWTVRVDPEGGATLAPSRGSPLYSGRALHSAEGEAQSLGGRIAGASCKPTAELEAAAAKAGVSIPPAPR